MPSFIKRTGHPKIETKTVWVCLTDISYSTPNIELVSYILTRDFNEFAAVREDLLLRLMNVVNESGTGSPYRRKSFTAGGILVWKNTRLKTQSRKLRSCVKASNFPSLIFRREIFRLSKDRDYPQLESALRNAKANS